MRRLTRREYVVQRYEVEVDQKLVDDINNTLHRFPEVEDVELTEDDIVAAWEEDMDIPVLKRDFLLVGTYRETIAEFVRDMLFDMMESNLVSDECMDAENGIEYGEEE